MGRRDALSIVERQHRNEFEKDRHRRSKDEQGAVVLYFLYIQRPSNYSRYHLLENVAERLAAILPQFFDVAADGDFAVAQEGHFFDQLFHLADEMGRDQDRLLADAELAQQGLQDASGEMAGRSDPAARP